MRSIGLTEISQERRAIATCRPLVAPPPEECATRVECARRSSSRWPARPPSSCTPSWRTNTRRTTGSDPATRSPRAPPNRATSRSGSSRQDRCRRTRPRCACCWSWRARATTGACRYGTLPTSRAAHTSALTAASARSLRTTRSFRAATRLTSSGTAYCGATAACTATWRTSTTCRCTSSSTSSGTISCSRATASCTITMSSRTR